MAPATLDMRISGASAIIVHHVPAALRDWFMDWQAEVTAEIQGFPGYRRTDVYPPPGGRGGDFVAAIHFDDEASLQAWLDSPKRASRVAKLREKTGEFDLRLVPGGFAPWFSDCVAGPGQAPPAWKTALVVLLGLYPTVMLLSLFPGAYTQGLGLAVAMLIGNALSVAALQWGVMPVLNVLSAPWLKADSAKRPWLAHGGLAVVLALLSGLCWLFRQVTG